MKALVSSCGVRGTSSHSSAPTRTATGTQTRAINPGAHESITHSTRAHRREDIAITCRMSYLHTLNSADVVDPKRRAMRARGHCFDATTSVHVS